MGSLTDYFNRRAYQPKYYLGDRVFGQWNRIPFIGTVGVDHIVNSERGPEVSVMLDLPIVKDGKIYKIIVVTHKDIKSKLVSY